MAAISTRQPSITISYSTARGARRSKNFSGDDLAAARSFFAQKLAASADPAIKGEKPTNWDAAADDANQELTTAVNAAIEANPAPGRIKLGVSPAAKTRAFYAGKIIAEFGHERGVQPEMIAALDEAYGTVNATESEISLRCAWHALRGYGLPTSQAAQ